MLINEANIMKADLTVALIKPDSFPDRHTIQKDIAFRGYEIVVCRQPWLDLQSAGIFYHEHLGQPFFKKLINFMASGPIVAMILRKYRARESWRNDMGATNPNEAKNYTLRYKFARGRDLPQNGLHGSASTEAVIKEALQLFGEAELRLILDNTKREW